MKILVVNAGSSSLKYQLIDMTDESVLAKGNCERIGTEGNITHKLPDGRSFKENKPLANHTEAFELVVQYLTSPECGVIRDMSEISAVGHRIVQGADRFKESVLVTEEVVQTIEEIAPLAPLHNPAHVQGIRACQRVLDASVPQVVVFDNAFHATMPPKAYMYALPYRFYRDYHIRKYGFHGTSHRFVSARCAELMGRPIEELKIVTCHLGNGSSICAVDGGRCVDTSMGFTPLDGLIMGTRSGSVDPTAIAYAMQKENITADELGDFLNKQSGYLGLTEGRINDDRDMRLAAFQGDEQALLCISMLRYQIKKFIGSYAAAMGGLDAVVFAGGIGENSSEVREEVCADMEFFGIEIDIDENVRLNRHEGEISTPQSKVRVFIIPTNEELAIARDTKQLVRDLVRD